MSPPGLRRPPEVPGEAITQEGLGLSWAEAGMVFVTQPPLSSQGPPPNPPSGLSQALWSLMGAL